MTLRIVVHTIDIAINTIISFDVIYVVIEKTVRSGQILRCVIFVVIGHYFKD